MESLALFGGEKAVQLDYTVEALVPSVSEKGIKKVNEMMRRGEISKTPFISEFEEKFANYIGTKYALAEGNGTSTLISAMYAIGIGPGDEVIVPSFSFWSTSACVLTMHGIPVFCDIDEETFNLDIEDIKRKITKRTKAIVVVHIYGNPANMDEIMKIAREHDLKVVEDCSHAHGALWGDKKVGSIGDIGCFSMQAAKLLSAGEGGMLVTNNFEYYQRAVSLGHYEKVQVLPQCSVTKYGLTGKGYKFRPHPLGIAIADSNLERLDELNEIRNRNAIELSNSLKHIEALKPQGEYDKSLRQYSYQYVKYDKEKFGNIPMIVVIKALRAEGVECTLCGFGKIHKSALFTEEPRFANGKLIEDNVPFLNPNIVLPISEKIADSIFMLAPRFEKKCPEIMKQFINAYEKVFESKDQLLDYANKNNLMEVKSSQMDLVKAITKFRKSKKEKQ